MVWRVEGFTDEGHALVGLALKKIYICDPSMHVGTLDKLQIRHNQRSNMVDLELSVIITSI